MNIHYNQSWYGEKAEVIKKNQNYFVINYGCKGKGIVSNYNLFDGISCCFLDFDTEEVMPSQKFNPDIISIVHCHTGRYECEFSNHQIFYLSEGYFSIMGTKYLPISFSFPLKKCYAFSLVIDKHEVSQNTKNILKMFNIDIDNLSNYDIDHILPQAFIKDDSLDNRVLVSRAVNNSKSDNVPVKMFGSNSMPDQVLGAKTIRGFWQRLSENNLISKKKYRNLTTNPGTIGKYTKEGFVKRQLVETSQVVKLVSTILTEKYQNEDTKIIEIKAALTHQFREKFGFIKLRNLNDFHHGFDAYIVNIIGLYLYKRYPKLRSYFVYNDFKKLGDNAIKNLKTFNFLGDIENKNLIEYDGQIVMDKQDVFKHLERAYMAKIVPVSKEVYTNENNMFKQTVFPASTASSKKLIRIKNDKPVDIYGGYTSNNDAYLAIVKQKDKYQVVGVPMRSLSKLQQAEREGNQEYLEVLKEELTPQFIQVKKNRKTGEVTKKVKKFDIVLGKVSFGQLVVDGDQKFTLGSSTYKYNASQLTLSKKSIDILARIGEKENTDEELENVYVDILDKVNKYYALYDINKFRERLNSGFDLFKELNIEEKEDVLSNMLDGLHANATFGNLKKIKVSTPFGQLQVPTGIKLSRNAELIYQSPTGLIERRVKLKNL